MRPIKFRHWTGAEMVAVYKITFNDDELVVSGDGVVHFANSDTVMQYTGLRDKNGREIYEGDIVHVWDNGIAVVKFDETIERGQWMCDFAPLLPAVEPWSEPLYGWLDGNVDGSVFEIIGNIYQDPEILELYK